MKLLVPALLLCASSLFARVGEKYADYEARVGKSTTNTTQGKATMAEHRENGRTVCPVVMDGVIISEIHETVKPDEVARILGASGLGEFVLVKQDPAGPVYGTKDGRYRALYAVGESSLVIHNVQQWHAWQATLKPQSK